MPTQDSETRTTRSPAVRRFRHERAKMALESAETRAEEVVRIAGEVTEIILAVQQDLAAKRAAQRAALSAFTQGLSEDVANQLRRLAEDRAARAVQRRDDMDAFREALRQDVERIVTSDFI